MGQGSTTSYDIVAHLVLIICTIKESINPTRLFKDRAMTGEIIYLYPRNTTKSKFLTNHVVHA